MDVSNAIWFLDHEVPSHDEQIICLSTKASFSVKLTEKEII